MRFFEEFMARLLVAAIFLGAITHSSGQVIPVLPHSEEHASNVSEILQSFEPPEVEEILTEAPEEEPQKWSTVENFAFGKDRGSMPMINDLSALHPYFREKVQALIEACSAKGIQLAVVETYRTRAKQNEYRSMGRIYTRSTGGHSKHQYGLAVDVVPIVDSVAQWHDPVLWKKIGNAGERLGLRWGGRWRRPYDPGHFEWSGGVTTALLEKGVMPLVAPQQYPCLDEDLEVLRAHWNEWESEQTTLFQSRAAGKAAME
jgi:hypothetical protein